MRGNARVELIKVTIKEEKKASLVSEVAHEYFKDLFEDLKQLRTNFARDENVPPYVVFSDATLVEMATYLPHDEAEMRKISGVGDLKLEKYGADFLEVIRDYCDLNHLESRINLKSPKRERKTRPKRDASGQDTYSISLEMFKSGMPVAEIARRREMAHSTIEMHLTRFVQSGELKLEEVVPAHKIEPIRRAVIKFGGGSMSSVKDFLGEDYSYGEIRAVISEFLNRNEETTRSITN